MATAVSAPGTVTTWNIDPAHSGAEFKVKHMMISNVKGKFSGLSGVLKLDETNYARSTVEASIPVSTVNTGDEKRDGHLVSADFFDAEKFPAMTFKSTRIESVGGGDYEVTGDLTIHGVTKSVVLAGKIDGVATINGKKHVAFTGTTTIDRRDYGMTLVKFIDNQLFVGYPVTINFEAGVAER